MTASGLAMAGQATAILLDCLGTLVELAPPAPRLAALTGVPLPAAERAMAAEIRYYRRHLGEARDAASLARLRAACAALVAEDLGVPVDVDTLLAALEFRPFAEVPATLRALRARGLRLAVVSNWDVSLHEVLARTGLAELVDVAVASAEVGAAKPDPRPFAVALAALGVPAARAWHVGDSRAEDVAGARAAGVRPLLIARGGGGDLRRLDELLRWLGG
jgi:putative hydrolase of the HAD superfamily